jgi:alanine racemase
MNRAEAVVDLNAIEANVKRLLSGSNSLGLAVVKADAYGHGLIPVARRALQAGASWLGTALLEEALSLRAAGLASPILAWLTPPSDDFESALHANIDLAVPSLDHLEAIATAARKTGTVARIHLEVDTGMSRGGALTQWRAIAEASSKLAKSGQIEVIGIWSHFARADEPNHPFNEEQVRNFQMRITQARELGIHPQLIHLSNSAATLTNRGASFDLVRLGIAMYGLSPDLERLGSSSDLELQPAMRVRARLQLVKDVPENSQVGYGGSAMTDTDTKLGVVAMGYADGIPRNATSATGVLAGNRLAPIIGRVSMDQFVVDLGKDSISRAGDWVDVISSDQNRGYTADAWAKACGTINYEIVTRIGPRVPRIYI